MIKVCSIIESSYNVNMWVMVIIAYWWLAHCLYDALVMLLLHWSLIKGTVALTVRYLLCCLVLVTVLLCMHESCCNRSLTHLVTFQLHRMWSFWCCACALWHSAIYRRALMEIDGPSGPAVWAQRRRYYTKGSRPSKSCISIDKLQYNLFRRRPCWPSNRLSPSSGLH